MHDKRGLTLAHFKRFYSADLCCWFTPSASYHLGDPNGEKIHRTKLTLEYDYSDSIFTHPLYLKEVVKLFRKEETDDFLTQITLFDPRATLSSF